MGTSKNILLYINGVSTARTHEEHVAAFMEDTKHKICHACGLSGSVYDEAHYDLAESWFRYHKFLEYTAKVFMLSKTYHRWWNQQLAQIEDEFLCKLENQQIPTSQLRESLFETIISMNILPASELRRKMHEEGLATFRKDPALLKLKIYRNV
jgi:hypothetical protein